MYEVIESIEFLGSVIDHSFDMRVGFLVHEVEVKILTRHMCRVLVFDMGMKPDSKLLIHLEETLFDHDTLILSIISWIPGTWHVLLLRNVHEIHQFTRVFIGRSLGEWRIASNQFRYVHFPEADTS